MRQATSNYEFLNEMGTYLGVSLGHDYCAEHEWGITEMTNALAIPELTRKNIGVQSRTITLAPLENIQYREVGEYTYFTFVAYHWRGKFSEDELYQPLEYKTPEAYKKAGILTAWDSKGFHIAGMGDDARIKIKELHDNYIKKNIALCYMGTSNPFSRPSLCVVIADRLLPHQYHQMKMADTEHLDLADITKKLNLEGKAKKKGMTRDHYTSISVKFIKYGETKEELEKIKADKKLTTKYNVQVWVNGNTTKDDYGWFTVEDVLDWIKHKGTRPISFYNKKE
jgi:hypothetical protein